MKTANSIGVLRWTISDGRGQTRPLYVAGSLQPFMGGKKFIPFVNPKPEEPKEKKKGK